MEDPLIHIGDFKFTPEWLGGEKTYELRAIELHRVGLLPRDISIRLGISSTGILGQYIEQGSSLVVMSLYSSASRQDS